MPAGTRLTAVLDANVLYPQFLRDLLLRLAAGGLYEPRWSARIHEEWTRNLRLRAGISPERVDRARMQMDAAFPGALVRAEAALHLPFTGVDAKDRHVAAAAVAGRASVIVTWNLRHFPDLVLQVHGLRAIDPDAFVTQLISEDRDTVRALLERHRTGLVKPPFDAVRYHEAMIASGLARAADLMR